MPNLLDDLDLGKKQNLVKGWMQRINDALAREKNYRKLGQTAVDLYEAKRVDATPFAILYSNTEVLQPALYNARPIPIVTRRFKDPDPIGKAAAETSTRLLKFLIDKEDESYDNFDELMQAANLNALLTNRGITRFKYVAHEALAYSECVYGEDVRWDKFFHGYARTWKKVPWIGFEWDMTADEIKENFPNISPLDFKSMASSPADDAENKAENRDELQGATVFKVYEIWDKSTKRVMFFSGVSKDSPLRMVDDPLGLSGFFPVPRPLNFMKKVSTLVPTPLYEHYKQQAAELNQLTLRLKAIIKAVRYRGAYNSTIEGIDKMLKADDNELVAVENMQSMPENTTIDKMLYIVPVNELVQTAQTLYQSREQCKSVIYEITGISDIIRGATVASETYGAQQLKSQWGTLRLKKMQKEVQRYCRESLAIILEIAAAKFEPQTIQQMTGLPYLFDGQKAQIGAQLQQAQMSYQTQASAAQAMGQQPPQQPPPQLPPELQQLMALPSWDQIVKLLHNDVARAYKTDIETNSTIDAEASQDKQDIAELLNAMSQFFNGFAPLVEQGVMPMELAKEMLLVVVRRYNFGSNLEDMLANMQAPQSQGAGAQQAQQAADAAKLAQTTAEAKAAEAEANRKSQLSAQEFQQKQSLSAQQAAIDAQALRIKATELDLQERAVKMKMAQQQRAHDLKMKEMDAKHREQSNASV